VFLGAAGVCGSRMDKGLTAHSTYSYCSVSGAISGRRPGLPRVVRTLRGNRAVVQRLRRVCRNDYFGGF
jgi:hypothetical protein